MSNLDLNYEMISVLSNNFEKFTEDSLNNQTQNYTLGRKCLQF
jgi:hypothetical protein